MIRPINILSIDLSSPGEYVCAISPENVDEGVLSHNLDNRRIRDKHVGYLARCMQKGEWNDDHPQPLVFNDRGELIDGQHRAYAVKRSGVTCIFRIRTGVPDHVRKNIDTGIKRELDDRMRFAEDLVINKCIATVVRTLFSIIHGGPQRLTTNESEELFNYNRDAFIFAAHYKNRGQKGTGRAAVCVALAEMYMMNPVIAKEFAESLFMVDGPNQAARVLRDHLLRNLTVGGGTSICTVIYNRCVYCMQAALDGDEIRNVRPGKWQRPIVYNASSSEAGA